MKGLWKVQNKAARMAFESIDRSSKTFVEMYWKSCVDNIATLFCVVAHLILPSVNLINPISIKTITFVKSSVVNVYPPVYKNSSHY